MAAEKKTKGAKFETTGSNLAFTNHTNSSVEQMVARWAHNPKVGGSSPPAASNYHCRNKNTISKRAVTVFRWAVGKLKQSLCG